MFTAWFADARAAVRPLPDAMALATTGPGGRASVRMVLLKDFDGDGFVFYSNYRSRKARELARSARASLLFYWGALERQVRIEGRVTKGYPARVRCVLRHALPRQPAGRLGFPAERDDSRTARRWNSVAPPPPPVTPAQCRVRHTGEATASRPRRSKFWQGRDDRLHDRILYRRTRNGRWVAERLAPLNPLSGDRWLT
jgi:pyridoxamine 5'-phosphate oxidase